MVGQPWFMVVLFLSVLLALAAPLSKYMMRMAQPARIGGWMGAFERLLYRAGGVRQSVDMPWTQYAVALLLFNALGAVLVYLLQRVQLWLPLNPQHLANVAPDSAFDSA